MTAGRAAPYREGERIPPETSPGKFVERSLRPMRTSLYRLPQNLHKITALMKFAYACKIWELVPFSSLKGHGPKKFFLNFWKDLYVDFPIGWYPERWTNAKIKWDKIRREEEISG